MRTLQYVFLIAATAVPSAGHDNAKIAYVYCPSGINPVLAATAYSSPPMSIPIGTLNCGEKVQVLWRKESWVRIAPANGERYGSIATLSRRKDQFVALNLPLPPEPRLVDQRTGTLLPRVTSNASPEYTQAALQAKIHGSVILKLTVGVDGTAHAISVVKGLGYGLDESAMKAVRSWKFDPALRNGVPVDFEIAWELEFPPRSR